MGALTSHTSSHAGFSIQRVIWVLPAKIRCQTVQNPSKMLPFWPHFTTWASSEFPSMKNVILKAVMVSFVPLPCCSVSQATKQRNIKNEKVIVTSVKKINLSYSSWLSENLLINLLLKGKFDSSSLDRRQELDSLGLFNGMVAAVCLSNILQGKLLNYLLNVLLLWNFLFCFIVQWITEMGTGQIHFYQQVKKSF